MSGIVVVGSINMDETVWTRQMPRPGQTVLGRDFKQSGGGKGANQALAAAKLGSHVAMVGRLGADSLGETLRQRLSEGGVDMAFVPATPGISTGVAVITVDDSAENTIVVAPGANTRLTPQDVDAAEQGLPAPSVVCAQLEVPIRCVRRTMELGRRNGALTVLNPAPAPAGWLEGGFMRMVDLLTPNEHELSALTGLPVDTIEQAETAARALLEQGVGAVIATLGSKGALYVDGGRTVLQPCYPVEAVDTTGAGDSFTGALCVGLDRGWGMEDCLRLAALTAALAVSRPGAQEAMPTAAEVRAFAGQCGVSLPEDF